MAQQQYWFMISSDWLYRWKCFVSNKHSHKQQVYHDPSIVISKSENERIGILPPGPISNESLFERSLMPEQQKLRRNLQLNIDYRKVNKDVWQILHRMYGGGPIIVREDDDIYSQDVSADLLLTSKRPRTGAAVKKGGAS